MTPPIHTNPSTLLTQQEIRNKLTWHSSTTRRIAEIVCAAYWDGKTVIDAQLLEGFSSDERDLVSQILSYGKRPQHDAAMHALACWCRIEHRLTQWNGRE
jgi:hypothetical protein